MIQLIIMNGVPRGPTCQALGLGLIVRYHPEPEILGKQFLPAGVGARWLGDSRYLRSEVPSLASWPGQGPRVGIRSWCRVAFLRSDLRRRCQVIFIESDRWPGEVLYKHARWVLSIDRPESSEGVWRLVVALEDVMEFEVIKFLLELSYLLAVCRHARVAAIQLSHDLVDDELGVVMDVKPLDPEIDGDAQIVDEGLIFCHVVCHA
jgi:hypothetical protein